MRVLCNDARSVKSAWSSTPGSPKTIDGMKTQFDQRGRLSVSGEAS